jgi:hypothetical protein
MNRKPAPTTADQIRECIEQSETLIRLENLTIESLKARLLAMGEPEKRPKLGHVDMLFCKTENLQTIGATRSDL